MPSIEPSAQQLEEFLAAPADDAPIVMINLLRYRDRAQYPPGSTAEPCSGRDAYQRYGAEVLPMLAAVGGKILWLGNAKHTVIGPQAERWDDAVLVQYPSRNAFLTMISRPEYQRIAVHRSAALDDSRLIATATASSGL